MKGKHMTTHHADQYNSVMQVLRSNNKGTISTVVIINHQAEVEEPGVKTNDRKKFSIHKRT